MAHGMTFVRWYLLFIDFGENCITCNDMLLFVCGCFRGDKLDLPARVITLVQKYIREKYERKYGQ